MRDKISSRGATEQRFEGDITIPRRLLAEAYRGLKRNYEMPELRREIDRLMAETPRSEIATPDRAEISRKSAESMEASETMLPCPSCGETDVDATFAQGHDSVNAGCMICGMMGPDSHTAKDAADRWNALPRSPRSATAKSCGRTGIELRYEEALRYISENAFAGKDWNFAKFILGGMTVEEARKEVKNLGYT